ncbi:MAG: glucan ABC transporter ATP-binding protein/ permease [Hyphomicrobiaceae bacterium]|nr:glucan ABC transporter ATP-binding protein/ permease [Hyphomicrobiaceae bacterium]
MGFLKIYLRCFGLLDSEKRIAIILSLAGAALALLQFAEPILFGQVVDSLSKDKPAMHLVAMWAGFGFLSVAASVYIATHADRLAHRRRLGVMAHYFEHVVDLPASFHGEAQSGRLIGIMLSGTDKLFGMWLAMFREHLTAFVALVILIPTALYMNWQMALLLIGLMTVYAAFSALVVHKTHFGQTEATRYHVEVSGRVGDVIGNVAVVQSFTRLQEEARALRDLMGKLLAAQVPVLTWWAVMSILNKAAATITIVAIFALGTTLHAAGKTTVGEIVSFVGFATLLIGRLDQLSSFVSRMFFDAPAMKQFFEILDERSTLVEKPDAQPLKVGAGLVAFEGVSFRYPGSKSGIFDVNFEARPGETVAIVGPTGSGKTTTLALLQRVRDPQAGRITIDGQDLRDVTLESVRHAIGVVFQDAGLFDRSIAENLRIGKPGASDDEIKAAARLAEAEGFILGKSDGYSTRAGERGRTMSGGERQRLAIARAILKDAPILILDEATSALDTETEAKIKIALDRLARGRTTFVIAHRLSTVKNADMILFMEEGRIVERGSYKDLVAAGGRFADLVNAGELSDEEAAKVETGA